MDEEILTGQIIHWHKVDEQFMVQTVEKEHEERKNNRQVQVIEYKGKYNINPTIIFVSDSFDEALNFAMEKNNEKTSDDN